jgi:hypothetical protein
MDGICGFGKINRNPLTAKFAEIYAENRKD